MSSDWWARRMQQQSAPPPRQDAYAPPPNAGHLYQPPAAPAAPAEQMVPVYDPQGRVIGYQQVVGGHPVPVPGMPAPGMPPNVPAAGQWQQQPEQLPYMAAVQEWTATNYKPKAPDMGQCPECGSDEWIDRSNGNRQLNASTGVMASPAPQCWNCGYAGGLFKTEQAGSAHGSLTAGVKVVGAPRMARGAGSVEQVSHQSGLTNLYAPK